jgi:F0F1-type ATP synthase delta subunit
MKKENMLSINGIKIKIDQIPEFLSICQLDEKILRVLVKEFLSQNPKQDIINEFWRVISEHQELSEDFVREYINEIHPNIIWNPCYRYFSDELKRKLEKQFKLKEIIKQAKISLKDLMEIIEEIADKKIKQEVK